MFQLAFIVGPAATISYFDNLDPCFTCTSKYFTILFLTMSPFLEDRKVVRTFQWNNLTLFFRLQYYILLTKWQRDKGTIPNLHTNLFHYKLTTDIHSFFASPFPENLS